MVIYFLENFRAKILTLKWKIFKRKNRAVRENIAQKTRPVCVKITKCVIFALCVKNRIVHEKMAQCAKNCDVRETITQFVKNDTEKLVQ